MIVYEEKPLFQNRADAGKRLAKQLRQYEESEVVVFAVPNGGVPVAIEVADKLNSPLDIVIPRKVTIPFNPEAGYGAVTEDGAVVLNEPLVRQLGLAEGQIQRQTEAVRAEIARRSAVYHDKLPASAVAGKTVIVIDDGLASGFTMLAAVKSLRGRKAARIVVAVPVASGSAYDRVRPEADDLVCVVIARTFGFAVASFYYHWYDLSDEEAVGYLEDWRKRRGMLE